jgi:hypothetical protein
VKVPPPVVVPPFAGFELVVIVNVAGAVMVTAVGRLIDTPSTVADTVAVPAADATMVVVNVPVALVVPVAGVKVTPPRFDDTLTVLLAIGLPY